MCNWNPGTREEKEYSGGKTGRCDGQKSLINGKRYKSIISIIWQTPNKINLSTSWSKF